MFTIQSLMKTPLASCNDHLSCCNSNTSTKQTSLSRSLWQHPHLNQLGPGWTDWFLERRDHIYTLHTHSTCNCQSGSYSANNKHDSISETPDIWTQCITAICDSEWFSEKCWHLTLIFISIRNLAYSKTYV